jgi:hypothetical protein
VELFETGLTGVSQPPQVGFMPESTVNCFSDGRNDAREHALHGGLQGETGTSMRYNTTLALQELVRILPGIDGTSGAFGDGPNHLLFL